MSPVLRHLGFLATQLALVVLFGAVSLFANREWLRQGEVILPTLADVEIALLFAIGFMLLSGFTVSLVIAFILYGRKHTWRRRSLLSGALYIIHMGVFWVLMGDSLPTSSDWLVMASGLIAIFLAERSTDAIWKPRCDPTHS